MLNAIIRNAKRLQKLTEDILDVTRIESQSLRINKEQFELNEIIENAVSDCKNHLTNEPHKGKDIKIVLLPPYEIICVEGDKNRLTQVISNLLNNVQNFTEKGVISILMEIKRGDEEDNNKSQIEVTIKDTGVGIS